MAETSTSRQFILRHIKHETKLNNTLYSMLLDQNLVDVILCCDGNNMRAHRLILSANSTYFKTLFDSLESNRCQIPIIVLKDVPLSDLKAILEFMYRGEVSVEERHLSSVLKSAELLKVFGLTEVCHALRSRLNKEANAETASSAGQSPQKRPRISDGVAPTAQPTTDFLGRFSNARFEIAPYHYSPPISSFSPTNQLRAVVSTAITSMSPSIVKNVILPSTQIHRKTNISDPQMRPKDPKTITPIEPIRVISSPDKGSPLRILNSSATVNQSTSAQKSGVSQGSTWTPSQQTSNPMPSGSGIQSKVPIEVLIDDEETTDAIGDPEDIKPPIFELNDSLNAERDVVVVDIESDSNKNKISPKRKLIPTETPKPVMKSSLRTIKSRTSSTSSQSSLPPPPSYRVVQRSSTRLLRNIIKPTTISSLTLKGKQSSDDKNKPKDRQSVRLYRQRGVKAETDPNRSYDESSPEVECPSCGLKFNDERMWNEHITSAHPPAQT